MFVMNVVSKKSTAPPRVIRCDNCVYFNEEDCTCDPTEEKVDPWGHCDEFVLCEDEAVEGDTN